ncbi:MAG: hypothetical protein AB7T06_01460, partial [Kofleriaceae bacterium]
CRGCRGCRGCRSAGHADPTWRGTLPTELLVERSMWWARTAVPTIVVDPTSRVERPRECECYEANS